MKILYFLIPLIMSMTDIISSATQTTSSVQTQTTSSAQTQKSLSSKTSKSKTALRPKSKKIQSPRKSNSKSTKSSVQKKLPQSSQQKTNNQVKKSNSFAGSSSESKDNKNTQIKNNVDLHQGVSAHKEDTPKKEEPDATSTLGEKEKIELTVNSFSQVEIPAGLEGESKEQEMIKEPSKKQELSVEKLETQISIAPLVSRESPVKNDVTHSLQEPGTKEPVQKKPRQELSLEKSEPIHIESKEHVEHGLIADKGVAESSLLPPQSLPSNNATLGTGAEKLGPPPVLPGLGESKVSNKLPPPIGLLPGTALQPPSNKLLPPSAGLLPPPNSSVLGQGAGKLGSAPSLLSGKLPPPNLNLSGNSNLKPPSLTLPTSNAAQSDKKNSDAQKAVKEPEKPKELSNEEKVKIELLSKLAKRKVQEEVYDAESLAKKMDNQNDQQGQTTQNATVAALSSFVEKLEFYYNNCLRIVSFIERNPGKTLNSLEAFHPIYQENYNLPLEERKKKIQAKTNGRILYDNYLNSNSWPSQKESLQGLFPSNWETSLFNLPAVNDFKNFLFPKEGDNFYKKIRLDDLKKGLTQDQRDILAQFTDLGDKAIKALNERVQEEKDKVGVQSKGQ